MAVSPIRAVHSDIPASAEGAAIADIAPMSAKTVRTTMTRLRIAAHMPTQMAHVRGSFNRRSVHHLGTRYPTTRSSTRRAMVKCHSDSNVRLHARSRRSRDRVDAALKAALRAVVRAQHWARALKSISGRATPSLGREMPARYSSVSRRLHPYRTHRTAGGYPPQPNGRRRHERYRTSPRRVGGRSPLDPNAIRCRHI